MTSKGLRQKQSFLAMDDQGKTRRLVVWAEIRDVGTLQNPIAELEEGEMPHHQIKTESGQHVNRITKGEYEIVETGKILTSADPNAA
jgi:Trp operon repressor